MKNRGRGVQLLLTRNPKKDFYPEGATRPRDLSAHRDEPPVAHPFRGEGSLLHPMRMLILSERSESKDLSAHRDEPPVAHPFRGEVSSRLSSRVGIDGTLFGR